MGDSGGVIVVGSSEDGIYDLGNGEGRWPGATRSQHYTAAVGHRLWFLLRTEQKAVSRSVHPACGITLTGL